MAFQDHLACFWNSAHNSIYTASSPTRSGHSYIGTWVPMKGHDPILLCGNAYDRYMYIQLLFLAIAILCWNLVLLV